MWLVEISLEAGDFRHRIYLLFGWLLYKSTMCCLSWKFSAPLNKYFDTKTYQLFIQKIHNFVKLRHEQLILFNLTIFWYLISDCVADGINGWCKGFQRFIISSNYLMNNSLSFNLTIFFDILFQIMSLTELSNDWCKGSDQHFFYSKFSWTKYAINNSFENTLQFNDFFFNISFQIVSLTELMAGVKAPTKTCQLFQLMCWPQGHKVPTSTNSLVELMNMVERWRQETDYGPVVVVST